MKLGDILAVEFDDHTEGQSGLCRFVVFGRLVKKTRTMLSVHSWCNADPNEPADENCVQYNISRKSVIRVAVLTEVLQNDKDTNRA